jgi:hypothetical protein
VQQKYFDRQNQKQNFAGTKAEDAAAKSKLVAAQKQKPTVQCEGNALRNVFHFKYLGSIFSADGDQTHDIQRRTALAASRCGKLRHCFDAQGIRTSTKLQIFKAAVTSVLTYGSEAWRLTPKAKAAINGANARLICRITGRTAHDEASPRNQTFNILEAIRKRKHEWLGHILRMEDCRLVKHAVQMQYNNNDMTNLLLDAPPTETFQELVRLASSRKKWKQTWALTQEASATAMSAVEVKWNEAAPTACVIIRPKPSAPQPKKPSTAITKYRARDAHEAFFRPTEKPKKCAKSRRKAKARGLNEPRAMTNRQRAIWARKHYEQHHGTTARTTTDPPCTPTPTDNWAEAALIPSGALTPTPTKSPKPTDPTTPPHITPNPDHIQITSSPLTYSFPQSMHTRFSMTSPTAPSLSPIPILSKKPLFMHAQLPNPLSPKNHSHHPHPYD